MTFKGFCNMIINISFLCVQLVHFLLLCYVQFLSKKIIFSSLSRKYSFKILFFIWKAYFFSHNINNPSTFCINPNTIGFQYDAIDVGVTATHRKLAISKRFFGLWSINELQTDSNLLLDLSLVKIWDHLNGFKLWNSSKMFL
jgi:hypothetical protein